MAYTLYIGNKNYSSWSLRGWLACKLSGAPFREVLIQLRGTYNPDNKSFSPTALVPALHDGDVQVWDTLAIGEYLAERHADVASNVRGRGLMCAFDLPDSRVRDVAQRLLWEDHVLVLPCGERSIRFRPALDVTEPELEFGLAALDRTLTTLAR